MALVSVPLYGIPYMGRRVATRIKARAIRRCGELLEKIELGGRP
jgi:hypothetical protein